MLNSYLEANAISRIWRFFSILQEMYLALFPHVVSVCLPTFPLVSFSPFLDSSVF